MAHIHMMHPYLLTITRYQVVVLLRWTHPGFAAKLAPAQAPPCLVTSGSEDPIAPRCAGEEGHGDRRGCDSRVGRFDGLPEKKVEI